METPYVLIIIRIFRYTEHIFKVLSFGTEREDLIRWVGVLIYALITLGGRIYAGIFWHFPYVIIKMVLHPIKILELLHI